MNAWKFSFHILFVKGIKWQTFYQIWDVMGLMFLLFILWLFIEQRKVLKNLIHDDIEESNSSNV